MQQKNEGTALQAIAVMQQGNVVDLNATLALAAARLSHELRLPMADSIKLATTRSFDAVLWTQDADFNGFDKVKFCKKES